MLYSLFGIIPQKIRSVKILDLLDFRGGNCAFLNLAVSTHGLCIYSNQGAAVELAKIQFGGRIRRYGGLSERPIENFAAGTQPRALVLRPQQLQQCLGNLAHVRLEAPAKVRDAANRAASRIT